MLLLRVAFAVVVLPGVVAFLVPLLVFAPSVPETGFRPAGILPIAAGTAIILWCVLDFWKLGRGTLAPWDPPRALVTRGLYRHSRNPMYLGVLAVVAGWSLGLRSLALAAYAGGLAALFHLRVVLHEEPYLARTHGAAWTDYVTRVPRWLGLPRRLFP
jgi:protein-S-isoprenylcysteine O-methyltransferase Ste14